MNPTGIASSLLGGGFTASSSAATGDTNVGQNFGYTSYSPFAVGSGATAEASGAAPSNALVWVLAAGVVGALGLGVAAIMLRK